MLQLLYKVGCFTDFFKTRISTSSKIETWCPLASFCGVFDLATDNNQYSKIFQKAD